MVSNVHRRQRRVCYYYDPGPPASPWRIASSASMACSVTCAASATSSRRATSTMPRFGRRGRMTTASVYSVAMMIAPPSTASGSTAAPTPVGSSLQLACSSTAPPTSPSTGPATCTMHPRARPMASAKSMTSCSL
uniref:Uncharacterized protein n=1 Tax=Oryza sativa subsp. japonica TaxID=39947 RepID=Q94H27_ORYSJ|nr:hypothetical protein [Oryza sativa Japonica Group]